MGDVKASNCKQETERGQRQATQIAAYASRIWQCDRRGSHSKVFREYEVECWKYQLFQETLDEARGTRLLLRSCLRD